MAISRDIAPHFIIGGMPRAGSSFLCTALDSHPEIQMAKPFVPEPKVFLGAERPDHEYGESYRALFAPGAQKPLRGEKSSAYFESEYCHRRIKAALPDVKMIFTFQIGRAHV